MFGHQPRIRNEDIIAYREGRLNDINPQVLHLLEERYKAEVFPTERAAPESERPVPEKGRK